MAKVEVHPERGERVRLDAQRLLEFCGAAFAAAGASPDEAATAAEVLVRTDLRGVHSHGVQTLPLHVRTLRSGGTRSPTSPTVVRQTPVTAVLDGQAGIGLVVARRAMELATEKAAASGIGVVLVRNSNHFGAAGHYALTAAEAGFIALATSNASPIMAAAGSRNKLISNAPIAYAVPTGRFPLALDVAMSATAGMKVRLAAERGERIPEGWVLDAGGRPTTDPGDYLAGGALAPLGGHKGYGLALLTETLAGALSGAAMTTSVANWVNDPQTPTGAGHAFVVLDVECFCDRATFYARMQELIDELHAAEPAPGVARVLVPGELEHLSEQRARASGLELEPVVWDHLEEVARVLDLREQLAAVPMDRMKP